MGLHYEVSSSVPSVGHLGASPRSILEADSVTVHAKAKKGVQVLEPKLVAGRTEPKLLKAVRDALKLDSFTLSAYDTAWVSRIRDDEIDWPRYPQALQWISSNQRLEGSWGDESSETSFDLVLSKLACLVSLKIWNSAPECSRRGEQFLRGALTSMKIDELTLVNPGMFHALAELLDETSRFEISLPYSCSIVEQLRTKHGQLLDSLRGKDDLIRTCPTRLLSFPECLQQVISWSDISKLQSAEGDLFSSPAATACLFLKTRDSKALSYLNGLLDRFGSAVPSIYPNRVSHVLSLVDHLERLNVDRHFHHEIYDVLRTLSRERNLETNEGTENMVSEVMIFRALREHGYDVLPGMTSVFTRCCNGSAEVEELGARCMLELYRASELKFPGEEILDYVKDRSTTSLTTLLSQTSEKDQSNLAEEIKYVLDFPSFMSNRPVESMSYMDRFQFKDDTKETYVERDFSSVDHKVNHLRSLPPCFSKPSVFKIRNTHVENLRLLAFAKSNFSSCQSVYQKELKSLARWKAAAVAPKLRPLNEDECRFTDVSFIRHRLYPSYLTAVGFASAPDLALARLSWAMNSVLTTVVDDLFDETSDLPELRLFVECIRRWDLSLVENCSEWLKLIARGLISSVNTLTEEVSKLQGRDLSHFFQRVWLDLVVSMMTEAEWTASGYKPISHEYMETSWVSFALGPIVLLAVFFLGAVISDDDMENLEYWDLFRSISTLGRLLNDCRTHQRDTEGGHVSAITVYMRAHPELTVEQATTIVHDMMTENVSKVFSILLNPNYSRAPVRTGWLNMLRALHMMYYRNVDGFSNTPAELKRNIKRFFSQPTSTEQP